jgi:hypothetical protein
VGGIALDKSFALSNWISLVFEIADDYVYR